MSIDQNPRSKCYHQRVQNYDELECEETGEIIDADFTVCQDCGSLVP